ncbi:MinD/ParA family ATP-binding protein [Sinomonas albida]|uniref:MinD/ParA family ATP-binding protein n=1 Tax=Sinomonas albida TaxID=369942 RepID=UPI001F456D2C|nr:MinD/ParA family protein [Sinomonas albida]
MTEENTHQHDVEPDGVAGPTPEADAAANHPPAEESIGGHDGAEAPGTAEHGKPPATHDGGEEPNEAGAPIEVVTVADAQDRLSAGSLAALTMPQPSIGSSVPPEPGRPPAGYLPQSPLPRVETVGLPLGDPAETSRMTVGDPRPPVEEEPAVARQDAAPEAAVSERRARPTGPEPASSLTSDRLIEKVATPPVGGWRLWLYKFTFGYVNLGDSDAVRMQRALEHRIATRLGDRTRYVPILSRKGGVGKTTVTTLLGMALAGLREDRVIALDANPDRGTLSDRNPGRATFTARSLVKDRFGVDSFAQLSAYTAREGSRLDVLASDADPMVADAFDDGDYRAVTDILGRYYSIVLTDSGTGMVHSVMKGTLDKADAVVLVSGGSVDEARLASETLSWLEAHGRDDLVKKAIVVVNMAAGDGTRVDIDEIEDHFRTRVAHVIRIPHDRHLAEGSQIEFDKLRAETRHAADELAALVVEELID